MDEKTIKLNDGILKEVAGGTDTSAVPRKFHTGALVRSISNPALGVGVIINEGGLEGAYEYAVVFGKEGLVLPEEDLVAAN